MKKQTIVFLRGIMGCGKSTKTQELLKDTTYRKVSRDSIRESMFGEYYKMNDKDENIVSEMENEQFRTLLMKGYNVIIDNMNIEPKYLQIYFEIARNVATIKDVEMYFEYIEINPTLDVIIANNEHRNSILPVGHFKAIPIDIVKQKHKEMLAKTIAWHKEWKMLVDNNVEKISLYNNPSFPKAVIFDIDGTLALMNGKRSPFDWKNVEVDDLNIPVYAAYKSFVKHDFKIIICTGRDGICETETKNWLAKNGIVYDEFYIRTTNDTRKDSIVKYEFLQDILQKYHVDFVMDDRNQVVKMWREVGLTCFQVAEGNF